MNKIELGGLQNVDKETVNERFFTLRIELMAAKVYKTCSRNIASRRHV